MVSREVGAVVRQRFSGSEEGPTYLDHLRDLARAEAA